MNSFSISKIARNLAIFTITLFVLGSCEKKEANNIGSGFHDGQKFGSGIYRNTKIFSYTNKKENIITSNSKLNLLGVYQDPIFGNIRSSFGIQVALSELEPNFGGEAKIDSVILTMPYLGRKDGGNLVYDTDSIYGDVNQPMHITIKQLQKLFHPDDTFYSDTELPTDPEVVIYDDVDFTAVLDSITLYGHDRDGNNTDTTTSPAAFRVKLNNTFFQDNIIEKSKTYPGYFIDNVSFITEVLNGFVFEIDASTDNGAIFSFDMFKGSSLVIYYKNEDKDTEGNLLPPQAYRLDFSSNLFRANKYEFNRDNADPSLVEQLSDDNPKVGSDYIFIQGMSGLEADIKLFTDDIQLDTLREQGWLINRAELVYRVSDDNGNASAPPFKLFMANSDSLKVTGSDFRMIDFVYEPTAFDGYLNSDATILNGGTEKRYYKFRITNHVAAILDGEIQYDEDDNIIFDENNKPVVKYDDASNYVIKLITFSGNESVSRVKLRGSLKKDKSLKNPALFLEIHYSKKDIL